MRGAGWRDGGFSTQLARRDGRFARARIEPERLRSLIRLVWHCSAVAWAGIGILLSTAPKMGSQARASIMGSAIGIYGFAAIANAWGTQGKHFG